MRFAALTIMIIALPFGMAQSQTASEANEVHVISQFSGKPVPRFESLRYAAANGRQGPSLNYPIQWRYERSGLPMLVLKESQDWRWVRDPDGDEVWIHTRMLSARQTVMLRSETTLYKRPASDAPGVAMLQPGVVANLEQCSNGWCLIELPDYRGWALQAHLWGNDAGEAGL